MRRMCLIGHDVGHNACCEAGLKSQREVVVSALVTERLTEPRVDVDAWGHPGLPHMRLDFTVVDAEAPLLLGNEKSAGYGTGCGTSRGTITKAAGRDGGRHYRSGENS